MSYCANCGTKLQDGFEFCPECGQGVSNNSAGTYTGKYKTCKKCGESMPEDAFYCLSCGTTFDDPQSDFSEIKSRVNNLGKSPQKAVDTSVGIWRNKWVALILCLFFGVFGIHRFYEGKKVTGFIYLFTFGILGLGVFFDLVLLITKPNPYRVK